MSSRHPKASDALMFSPLATLLPLGGALLHFATRPHKWSKGARWALAGSAAAVGLGLMRWQLGRVVTPKPTWEVLERVGDLEIRRYPQAVLVSTEVSEHFDSALEDGFERLFRYIRGENDRGEKIEMTAPVTTQRQGQHYTVSFFLPSDRPLEAFPTPTDPSVHLAQVPERTVAVMSFTGRYNAESVKDAMGQLRSLTQEQQLKVHGKPLFAAFDGPSTLPLLRHNEVWSELVEPTPEVSGAAT